MFLFIVTNALLFHIALTLPHIPQWSGDIISDAIGYQGHMIYWVLLMQISSSSCVTFA